MLFGILKHFDCLHKLEIGMLASVFWGNTEIPIKSAPLKLRNPSKP